MKIGIYFSTEKNQGGVYQYSTTMLEVLLGIPGHKYTLMAVSSDIPEKIKKSGRFKVVNLHANKFSLSKKIINAVSYFATYFFPHIFHNSYDARLFSILTPLYKLSQKQHATIIDSSGLDLMFYPVPSNLSFLSDTPSVVAVHDLMHRAHPQSPEVSAGGRWENREYVYQNICKKAFRILVDSNVGKEDVTQYYKTDLEKVVILPFLPPTYLIQDMPTQTSDRICAKLGLPEKFIFYPAKFWPHKNHINLIKAVDILKKEGKVVNLILTGSKSADFSTFNEVMKLVSEYDLDNQVFYLGYQGDKEISAIYKKAKAIVMPTFFGPTNIPILEAWAMGTPAITSDIRGCRDQLGDAGLLINPKSPTDIAKKIWKIYNNEQLRQKLIEKGKKRLSSWTFSDFSGRIIMIINDFENKLPQPEG